MEPGSRVYGKVANINREAVHSFFDKRASQTTNGYTSVLLGDQNPDYAKKWDKFEKSFILPKLELSEESSFLDIGCGIGRWGDAVIPLCNFYCGCDFSSEMIATAKNRMKSQSNKYEFHTCSFQDTAKELTGKTFDRVIIAGCCMYINDSELSNCFESLLSILKENTIIYLTETVAVEKRLTLNNFYSSAMKTEYSSIYRTPSEYNKLYSILLEKGFEITTQDFMPHLNNEPEYSETDRWYTILRR